MFPPYAKPANTEAAAVMFLIPAIGGSMINIGIGVTIVEGNPEAAIGFILNVPANLTLSIDDEKDTGPFTKTPFSLLIPTAFGPLANIELLPSNNKKLEEFIFSLYTFILSR